MPSPTPPLTYTTLVQLYTTHLTICIHTILAARALYPRTSFLRARAYNLPVMQSRHPGVCQWISDAVKAVEIELLKGTVARVALVVWGAWWEGDGNTGGGGGGGGSGDGGGGGSGGGSGSRSGGGDGNRFDAGNGEDAAIPLERYVWDISRWPVIPAAELHTPLTRPSDPQIDPNGKNDADIQSNQELTDEERRAHFHSTLKQAHTDLHEQFRALLSRLSSISARLTPLPGGAERCTYTLAVELREEAEPPIGHPQVWVPCERGAQRGVVFEGGDEGKGEGEGGGDAGDAGVGGMRWKGKVAREKEGGRMLQRGKELGGVRTTPVRTIDQGEMVFEMWIEEGRAKFDNRYTRQEGSNQTSPSST